MKINAVIAAAILASTTSGLALPVAPRWRPAGLPSIGKREAEVEAFRWRPTGLPSIGKREAEAEADPEASRWRPAVLPAI